MKTQNVKNQGFRLEAEVKPLRKTDLLEIKGREWFDKVNGNSYHCVYISINNKLVITVPFTYGYGDAYIQSATQAINDAGIVNTVVRKYWDETFKRYASDINHSRMIDRFCREAGIHCVCHIERNCKKNQLAKF
jgi:hypothetical protein